METKPTRNLKQQELARRALATNVAASLPPDGQCIEGERRQMLRPPRAAAYLGISPKTLSKWRWEGVGPPFKRAGRCILYAPADLDAWLSSRTFTSTSEADHAA